MVAEKKNIYIVDGAGFYYRAFYGMKTELTNKDNIPTNAIYGFVKVLHKLIEEQNPYGIVIALDSKEKTFRHELYSNYKSSRPQMPDDLAVQLPYIYEAISALNIPTLKLERFEADDIIGTVAAKIDKSLYNLIIVSSDKDMLQCLDSDSVKILDPMKNRYLGDADALKKFGVSIDKIVDAMGLIGDSSDDIPGVAGIGPKWAAKLLDQFGNLEMLLANKDKIENPNIRAKIVKNEELARLSKELATVEKNIPIDLNPEDWKLKEANYPKLLQLYEKLDFHSLIKSIPSVGKNIEGDYLLIDTEQLLIDLVQRLATTKTVAINHYFESKEDIIDAKLNGISISTRANEGFYIPLRENRAKILSLLEALLEDEQITKIGANLKELIILLANEGINLKGRLFDIIIVAYLLEPDKNHTVSKLAFSNLSIDMESTVKPDTLIDENSLKSYGADADIILRLYETLKVKLKAESLDQLNKTIEEPLIRVLASMEQSGILVDNGVLNQLSDELKEKLTKLEDEIFAQAGEEFNLNSPKQLAKVLFENLKLPHFKKTKSGYSTDHSVLVHLAKIDPLPKLILEYRRLSKLKNGYSDPLPKLINKRSRRIHTSFNQTVAATGRLSSSDPNLQNIPTREVEGKIIRSAFVADNQFLLISSDYSQIELRLLAHFSDEDTLIDAFIRSADIHLDTACKIYNVTPELITKDMRHAAKTVNYSVIYGKTPFGLAEDLQIPINVAKKFIDDYFAMFPKIQQYIDKTIDEAGETLFVKTLFDRKRFFPDLRSKNRHLLSAARRGAINAIMQGSAADIIKYAMIKISNRLIDESLKSKMLLQVHDELLFEAPLDEVDYLSELVKEEMESHFDLKVPLLVDINSAANWNLAH